MPGEGFEPSLTVARQGDFKSPVSTVSPPRRSSPVPAAVEISPGVVGVFLVPLQSFAVPTRRLDLADLGSVEAHAIEDLSAARVVAAVLVLPAAMLPFVPFVML